MSRRQNRKRLRKQAQRERLHDYDDFRPNEPAALVDIEDTFLGYGAVQAPPLTKACGSCHEFIEDQDLGRGTCLHPASGVFAPWYDTPACPYYRRS